MSEPMFNQMSVDKMSRPPTRRCALAPWWWPFHRWIKSGPRGLFLDLEVRSCTRCHLSVVRRIFP